MNNRPRKTISSHSIFWMKACISDGTSGKSGTSGPTGATGSPGTNGTSGTSGASGPTGATGLPGTNGTSGTSGATGAAGTPGTSGTSGTSPSTAITGNTNDYLVTATGNSTTPFNGESKLTFDGTYLYVDGTIRATGDVVAYYSSDARLKDNIKRIENPIEKIKKLNGVEFDWNNLQDVYTGHDIGVIAQEVESVLPELVETRHTGYKAVKYEKLVSVLIEAIKEQQKQIDELKSKLQ